jgi:protein-tyrosine-phosphatase
MAESLLSRALLEAHPEDFAIASAGFGPSGAPAEREVIEVMAEIGLDVSYHRSTTISSSMLAHADLVLAMTRQHVMEVALLEESAWPKTFLLAEFASLAEPYDASAAATDPGKTRVATVDELRERVARLHQGRRRADLLTLASSLEISDPIGGPLRGYRFTRDRISELVTSVAGYLCLPATA